MLYPSILMQENEQQMSGTDYRKCGLFLLLWEADDDSHTISYVFTALSDHYSTSHKRHYSACLNLRMASEEVFVSA